MREMCHGPQRPQAPVTGIGATPSTRNTGRPLNISLSRRTGHGPQRRRRAARSRRAVKQPSCVSAENPSESRNRPAGGAGGAKARVAASTGQLSRRAAGQIDTACEQSRGARLKTRPRATPQGQGEAEQQQKARRGAAAKRRLKTTTVCDKLPAHDESGSTPR